MVFLLENMRIIVGLFVGLVASLSHFGCVKARPQSNKDGHVELIFPEGNFGPDWDSSSEEQDSTLKPSVSADFGFLDDQINTSGTGGESGARIESENQEENLPTASLIEACAKDNRSMPYFDQKSEKVSFFSRSRTALDSRYSGCGFTVRPRLYDYRRNPFGFIESPLVFFLEAITKVIAC